MSIGMDRIIIRELQIFAHHGVLDFEKENGQYFYVNAQLGVNIQKAGMLDDLNKTVNYADVCSFIEMYLTDNDFELIETCAEKLAAALMNEYPDIKELDLEIRKPEAPVEQNVESLSVRIFRKRHNAYIAYGSNMGDSRKTIETALEFMNSIPYCCIVEDSGIVQSTAYGKEDQPDFLNGIIHIETYLEPENLLDVLQYIENKFGRVRKEHWGPRTLDLDIILYDNMIIDSERLIVPHPDMANRDFVLAPLAKLAGWYRHPILNLTINELLTKLQETHIVS